MVGYLFDLSGILRPNFPLAAQVFVEEFFGRFVTIFPDRTTCHQNSTVFCSSTTKNEKLTSCTRINYWLASEVVTKNTCQLLDRCHNWAQYSLCCYEKKLQTELSAARKRKTNNLCLTTRS